MASRGLPETGGGGPPEAPAELAAGPGQAALRRDTKRCVCESAAHTHISFGVSFGVSGQAGTWGRVWGYVGVCVRVCGCE